MGFPHKPLDRSFAGALAIAFVLALAGCGGDDEEPSTSSETQSETAEQPTTATETASETTETAPPPTAEEPPKTETTTSPEDEPGGGGDEEPARSLALFTGEGGRITPRLVRVPPFISIRVELRSADGREYGLTFAGETIRVSSGLGSVSTTIDGLRPNAGVVGIPTGASNRVRIAATAEPGP
ncbi:MAG: hypothetical protein ABW135_08490 [Thermoleophilaceae bacterium]